MLRLNFLIVFAALVLATPASALAAGNGNGTDHFGPFASSSPDNGTCGIWAQDTFNRYWMVHDNGDGTFSVREEFKDGSFVTTGPLSPGCGETTNHHGHYLSAGIEGHFTGFLAGTVSSTTYNPNGCDAAGADCTTTAGFIAAVFGPGASFTCFIGYARCQFNFEYDSPDQSLQYHHWQDKSDNHGGEQFIGDIANS